MVAFFFFLEHVAALHAYWRRHVVENVPLSDATVQKYHPIRHKTSRRF